MFPQRDSLWFLVVVAVVLLLLLLLFFWYWKSEKCSGYPSYGC